MHKKLNKDSEEMILKQLKQDMLWFNTGIAMLIMIIAITFSYTIYRTYYDGGSQTMENITNFIGSRFSQNDI